MSESAPLPVAPQHPSRDPDSRRFRAEYVRGVRYGISLTAVVLGSYLLLQWSPAALVSMADTLWALQIVAQLAIGIVVLAGGLAIAPTSILRALVAAVLVVVIVVVTAVLVYLRLSGTLRAGPPFLWAFLGMPTAVLLPALLGWLIVRRRPALTGLLLLGALFPALVRQQMPLAGVESAVIWFSDLVLSLGVGVVVAWIAYAFAALTRSSTSAAPGDAALRS